ncbi:RidA family protein [Salisediminibacterium beveridgei]|uniref:Endoribonuclease L-PSP n=1 Tax=Salisediminibacterium beveridgei TaxID=632773 RepID=A0A1D7QR64_9BACI|nr:RidA family protein [Salisediminibacterium beveridgei]AOM81486.1 Endoribonuclease L-PSP [Salisediminibacterium beveridgei]
MTDKHRIVTNLAPDAIGPYSQAIEVDGMLYCSGQIPLVPETMELVSEDVEEQTHQVMKNVKGILTATNRDYSDIVKAMIFLDDMNDFGKVNEIYASYLNEPYPARSAVEVAKLPKGAKVEIEVIAK